MADPWTALLQAWLVIVNSRLAHILDTTWKDSSSLAGSLVEGADKPALKAKLAKVQADLKAASPKVIALNNKIAAIHPLAYKSLDGMATAAAAGGNQGVADAGVHMAGFFIQLDAAIEALAVAVGDSPEEVAEVRAITTPWKKGLVGDGPPPGFDAFFAKVFGLENAGAKLAETLTWDQKLGRITSAIAQSGDHDTTPPVLSFDGVELEAYLQILGTASVGVQLKTKMEPGLRADPMVSKLIPTNITAGVEKTSVAITLDSASGLTLGSGPDKRIVLPVRASWGPAELRELAISQPAAKNTGENARIDVTAVVAGKFGEAVAVVAEGGGVSLEKSGGGPFVPKPKRPEGLGFRIKAGPVSGGGYLRYREDQDEYGGVLDISILKVSLTAVGLVTPDPFSFVVVMGVEFLPGVPLGFGFSLDGIGGLLAIDRDAKIDALGPALKQGLATNLLFPNDPIVTAPGILNQLATVFPYKEGGFLVGPMVEIGWGGPSGVVKARVGVIIVSPAPKILVLGALEMAFPPPGAKDAAGALKANKISLKADILAVIDPDQVFVLAVMKGKIVSVEINGDIGVLVRWAGGSQFAISAGGFYPGYAFPKELGKLARMTIPMGPSIPKVTIKLESYFAVTSNTVQFGGHVLIAGKFGPVELAGDIGLDALFAFDPAFSFTCQVGAEVSLKFKKWTLASVGLHGTLAGPSPWSLEGTGSFSILWWDVDFHVGRYTWGEGDSAPLAPIDAMAAVVAALQNDRAWKALPGPTALPVCRLAPNLDDALVLAPNSVIEARQSIVPLNSKLQRIGMFATTVGKIDIGKPTIAGVVAPLVTTVTEEFAPGLFLNLTHDEQLARPEFEKLPAGFQAAFEKGAKLSATPVEARFGWETFFPAEPASPKAPFTASNLSGMAQTAGQISPAALAKRLAGNPYLPEIHVPIEVIDNGLMQIMPVDVAGQVGGQLMPASQAITVLEALDVAAKGEKQLVAAGLAA